MKSRYLLKSFEAVLCLDDISAGQVIVARFVSGFDQKLSDSVLIKLIDVVMSIMKVSLF